MDTTSLRLAKSQHRVTSSLIENAKSAACSSLLSGQSVHDGLNEHTFDDALEFLWGNTEFTERVINEFKLIASSENKSILQDILVEAVEAYVETFAHKLAERNLADTIQSHVENLDYENITIIRGVV